MASAGVAGQILLPFQHEGIIQWSEWDGPDTYQYDSSLELSDSEIPHLSTIVHFWMHNALQPFIPDLSQTTQMFMPSLQVQNRVAAVAIFFAYSGPEPAILDWYRYAVPLAPYSCHFNNTPTQLLLWQFDQISQYELSILLSVPAVI